jgi:hypothetical protein
MENSNDHHSLFFNYKKYLIREPSGECAPDRLVNDRILLGNASDGIEEGVHGEQELWTKPGDPGFIPVESFRELSFGLWTDNELMTHARFLMRSWIILHGDPAFGSLW